MKEYCLFKSLIVFFKAQGIKTKDEWYHRLTDMRLKMPEYQLIVGTPLTIDDGTSHKKS